MNVLRAISLKRASMVGIAVAATSAAALSLAPTAGATSTNIDTWSSFWQPCGTYMCLYYSPNLANSINYNRVASRLYWDLSGSIDLMNDGNRKVQLFGSIYNLFDKNPPRQRLYGNPVLFDAIGRSYRVGLRTTF